ncbi:MAG: hypothetical protein V4485_02350 [Pseudomonadota bacterium]
MFVKLCAITAFAVLSLASYAADKKEATTVAPSYEKGAEGEYHKIVEEYKAYLAKVKPEIREEIKDFRTEIAKINKQKNDIYKALSQEAQRYLAEERKLKKRLPKHQRNLIGKDHAEVGAK